jgi:hypothetical protein
VGVFNALNEPAEDAGRVLAVPYQGLVPPENLQLLLLIPTLKRWAISKCPLRDRAVRPVRPQSEMRPVSARSWLEQTPPIQRPGRPLEQANVYDPWSLIARGAKERPARAPDGTAEATVLPESGLAVTVLNAAF